MRSLLLALLLIACAAPRAAPLLSEAQLTAFENAPLEAIAIDGRWNEAVAPFNIIGNVYYVGREGVASYLIATPNGHFLIDGGLPQSAPLIIASIRALGFDIRDVKYLMHSHAHPDHAGGLARLQRASGAVFVASEGDRAALEAGRVVYAPHGPDWPPVRVDRVVADGETITLGGAAMTAHLTPGHTPGCTSWSTETRGADGALHRVLFHCSAAVAGQSLVPEAYPGMVGAFRTTFARVRDIDADVFLASHGWFFDLAAKRERQLAGDANAFVDPQALQRFNTQMESAFNTELARQQAAASAPQN